VRSTLTRFQICGSRIALLRPACFLTLALQAELCRVSEGRLRPIDALNNFNAERHPVAPRLLPDTLLLRFGVLAVNARCMRVSLTR